MGEDDEQARKKKEDLENKKLWQDLQIDFRLEAFRFPDNKIYGTINILPESSRKLIKKFILVVNKKKRVEFEPHYKHLSASGFDIYKVNPSAYIEAIPIDSNWSNETKTSKICYFFFTGEIFALSPMISFTWEDNKENSPAKLVIRWYHIGDKCAQKYILYLDDVDIQYIHQKIIDDAFVILISNFQPGEKHTLQLAARLNNGKETYRSDLIEFIVPSKESTDEGSMEVITVSNEPIPPNLPAYIATKDDKTQEEYKPDKQIKEEYQSKKNIEQNKLPQTENYLLEQIEKQQKEKSQPKTKKKLFKCCDHSPHETFPGIEHYFNTNFSFVEEIDEETTDDDDDDVILPNN